MDICPLKQAFPKDEHLPKSSNKGRGWSDLDWSTFCQWASGCNSMHNFSRNAFRIYGIIRLIITSAYSHFFFWFREFTLAEIEHFVDPTDKSHPKFENVSSQKVTLYPSENQIEGKPSLNISLEDAVNQVGGLLFLRHFCQILTLCSSPHSFFKILALYQKFHSCPPCDCDQFFHY